MHKTLIGLILVVFLSAASPHQNRLDHALQRVFKLPEAKMLLAEIEKEGPVSFELIEDHEASKFGAFWDLEDRVIAVNPSFHKDEGSMIGSILFEMQNAKRSKEFHALFEKAEAGQIDKESYVRAVEYIEYTNSKAASSMADMGIQQGLFPWTAGLPTYKNFEEHYYWQHYGGHSQQIGLMYDRIAPRARRA